MSVEHEEQELDADFSPSIGSRVFFYSTKAERIVEGKVEGYASLDWTRFKVIEDTPEGKIRHVVNWSVLRPSREQAELTRIEIRNEKRNVEIAQDMNLYNGCVVWVRPSPEEDVHRDKDGEPIPYQVVAIYGRTGKAKLVTDYGEEIGTIPFELIVKTDLPPLFSHAQYSVDEMVTWIDGDDVYMGRIEIVHDWTVEVVDVCKLMPADYRKRLPFYKVPDGRNQQKLNSVIKTIIEEGE